MAGSRRLVLLVTIQFPFPLSSFETIPCFVGFGVLKDGAGSGRFGSRDEPESHKSSSALSGLRSTLAVDPLTTPYKKVL